MNPVPTFTSAPTIGTRTTSSIPINFTSDTTGTVYGARLTDGSGTPTCNQLEAQTAIGGVQYWSEAVTATIADSHTFGSITDGTVTDGYFCIEDSSGNDSAVASIANMYKLPAFTVNPTVNAQDDNDYTISETLDGAGTVYAVACLKGSTAPTVAQVEAGHCTGDVTAIAAVNESVTGADTQTLGGSLTRPIHDIYVVGAYGTQHEAAVHTLASEMLDAPSGKQYITLASISSTSFCKRLNDRPISPLIAVGDILKIDTLTDPDDFTVNVDTACDLNYSGSSARQLIQYDVWDISADAYMAGGPGNLWFNDQAPVAGEPETDIFLNVGEALSLDLCAQFTDFEGDTLTGSHSSTGTGTGVNKHPVGTTLSNCTWSGTPSAEATGEFTFTATDIAGATGNILVRWETIDTITVPNVVGEDSSQAINDLEAVHLSYTLSTAFSNTVPVDKIISQAPAASTEVEPFSVVALTVSRGPEFTSGTFTGTLTGVSGTVTNTLRYSKSGAIVTLYIPQMSGTSNATTLAVTGMPEAIWPTRAQRHYATSRDNGTVLSAPGLVQVETTGMLTFYSTLAAAGFTASGTKGVELQTVVFSLD